MISADAPLIRQRKLARLRSGEKTRERGTGAGFCYNVGRAVGALFPGIIGFLAAAIGLGGAVAFGVFGYVLAILALRFLPETHGKELVPFE